jgi:hypothetical protein
MSELNLNGKLEIWKSSENRKEILNVNKNVGVKYSGESNKNKKI